MLYFPCLSKLRKVYVAMTLIFSILELIGTVAFALSGALTAMKKEMDIFGACVLGMTTAIGGGIIRDILIGVTPPSSLTNPMNAFIAIAISVVTYVPPIQKFVIRKHKAYDLTLFLADSVGLGVFTVVGASTAFEHIEEPHLFTAVFLGVLTGVGGGILRDVFSREVPIVFVKNFYASAAIIGGLCYALAQRYLDSIFALSIGIVVVLSLRVLAASFRWELPKPRYHGND